MCYGESMAINETTDPTPDELRDAAGYLDALTDEVLPEVDLDALAGYLRRQADKAEADDRRADRELIYPAGLYVFHAGMGTDTHEGDPEEFDSPTAASDLESIAGDFAGNYLSAYWVRVDEDGNEVDDTPTPRGLLALQAAVAGYEAAEGAIPAGDGDLGRLFDAIAALDPHGAVDQLADALAGLTAADADTPNLGGVIYAARRWVAAQRPV